MDRHIPFDALHNFRDLGGYRTADGRRIRPGRLYRADSLGKLTEGTEDWTRFLALGVRTVIDLRYPWEIDSRGRVPDHPTLTYHNLSIEHRPYNQAALTADVQAGPYLSERFLEVAEDGAQEIRQALEVITKSAESDEPLVFHCASGKDRTGELAALVLSLLGVDEPTIVEDFTLTELATEPLLAEWRTRNNGDSPTWPDYGRAPASVMRLFLKGLKDRYGSVEAYVTDALALNAQALTRTLRAALLEQPPTTHPALTFHKATEADAPTLARLHDSAALWMLARGIDQWKPGRKDEAHFRTRMSEGEVWLAHADGHLTGAWELWWSDPAAWGPRPDDAGYIHRLMTTPHTAPPGTGRRLLAEAESRIATTGRPYARLDCLTSNPRLRTYYETTGYRAVGERHDKTDGTNAPYGVTLMEKKLG
ncbi:tyrosine-protein phosphatase [Streptomyces sp. GXMU-J15]|uniref:Tyrosine-protein phosphatase n=1 Tax=Streptomyces fuscus TaxID=3048495 RepID=A0ABT7JD53_9ACTN|nr:tyrosine-protein phosphatase [Streptomyces fuscus]MDL2081448.1 tyrosine-protein phosphatase [Streptomyces fuscus]